MSPPEDPPPNSPPAQRLDGVCILILDDNEEYCRILSRALERIGAECHVALTVPEAKRLLVVKEPDAALVDFLLLNGHGMAVIREFQEYRPSLACVLHSSFELPEGAELNVPFVQKPCDLPVLVAVLLDEIGRMPTEPPPTERGT